MKAGCSPLSGVAVSTMSEHLPMEEATEKEAYANDQQ